MSKTKFIEEIISLLDNRHKIPDEFWQTTPAGKYEVIWFLDRQKPSVEANYSFDEERFGITKQGDIIWGFHSGCSCPSPWSNSDYHDAYSTTSWKEFIIQMDKPDKNREYEKDTKETALGFDIDWADAAYDNFHDYLLLLKEDLSPEDVLKAKNAEVRRYLMKRIGYENIKIHTSAKILHTDGTSELIQLEATGEKYVKVKDSSTDREYLLYVPEHITNCKQGIAWTFGLNEQQYNPLKET